MNRIISALLLALAASLCQAADQPLSLAEHAPERYTVVRGDTLWDISAKFLKKPWRWPELWRMNRATVKNPHLIYPGDVLILEYDAKGQPRLRLQRKLSLSEDGRLQPTLYAEQIEQAIPPIPPNVIEPFLSEPLIVEAKGLENAARIVATQQDRVFLGRGDLAYVDDAEPDKEHWQVYRNGKALADPENPEQILGYEAFYLGTAKQARPGSPAIFEIMMAKQEVGRGDRLIPAVKPRLTSYVPHKPDTAIDGRIISVYGGVGNGGRGSIVSFNRGTQNGLEIGHVLALERNRVAIGRDEQDQKMEIPIPPERTGLIFVFRTFEQISYALVLQSVGTIEVNDFVRTPE